MHITPLAIECAATQWPSGDDLAWFGVRQPGILRFLESRLSGDDGALAVAVAAAWRMTAAYRLVEGLPCPRLAATQLERSLFAVVRESAGPVTCEGIAERQPALCDYVLRALQAAPIPLDPAQERIIAQSLWAVVYALDEAVTGRPVP